MLINDNQSSFHEDNTSFNLEKRKHDLISKRFHFTKRYSRSRSEAPIAGSSLKFQLEIHKYEGTFNGFGVWIENKDHAEDLFQSGYFGKGILSRSKPTLFERSYEDNTDNNSKMKRHCGFHRRRVFVKKAIGEQESKESNQNDAISNEESSSIRKSYLNEKFQLPENTEYLQLSLEEAFFLVYALKCMLVKNQQNHVLSIEECWNTFCFVQPNFFVNYVCYHHYRGTGWIPKSGIKYGTDWILYRNGPFQNHAEKTIIVACLASDSCELDTTCTQRKLNWPSLINVNRVSEQVNKCLSIFYVRKPLNVSNEELQRSPCYLPQFSVLEMSLIRWVPSRSREGEL